MVQMANLQSLLASRPNKPLYAVLLFRLGGAASGRGFLKDLLPDVTSGSAPDVTGRPILNVFLSWRAISVLVAGHPRLDPADGRRQFEPFFADPLRSPSSLAMADQLGFVGPSAPAHWWADFGTEDIDLAVYVGSDDDAQRQGALSRLRAMAANAELFELSVPSFPGQTISGYRPPGGRLHFGYRDGITSPEVDWDDAGLPNKANLREFILGYPNDIYPTTPYPAGPWRDFAQDGSFACLTWIHQDVAAFESFLSGHASALAPSLPGVDPREWLAAQLMGRWRDGSPLASFPTAPPSEPNAHNDFGYADDGEGARCPLDAHIRVVNCRDQPLSFPNASRFRNGPPLLIRRGFSYGEPLASETDDGKERGLFGVFLCARVNEQFYTVLRWMQRTDFSDAFDKAKPGRAGQDRLLGSRLPGGANTAPNSNIPVSDGSGGANISLGSFAHYKGVAILFVPSVAALQKITEI